MFLKGRICPCGFVGTEEGQVVAEDATHQIQCSLGGCRELTNWLVCVASNLKFPPVSASPVP